MDVGDRLNLLNETSRHRGEAEENVPLQKRTVAFAKGAPCVPRYSVNVSIRE